MANASHESNLILVHYGITVGGGVHTALCVVAAVVVV